MQTQSIATDAVVLLPQCHCCKAPLRIRTIDIRDRYEQVRFACTACGAETTQSSVSGNEPVPEQIVLTSFLAVVSPPAAVQLSKLPCLLHFREGVTVTWRCFSGSRPRAIAEEDIFL